MPHSEEAKSHELAKQLRRTLTDTEVILWRNLRRSSLGGLRFRRQHPIGPYVADFACLPIKLVVEVDGATHCNGAQIAHDRRRRAFMARYGWHELRVTNFEVCTDLGRVLERILRDAAKLRAPSPAEAGED